MKKRKALVMFSGGLDSVVASHLLKTQGVDVVAVHYVLPFYAGVGNNFSQIKSIAKNIGIELLIVEEGEDYLNMFKNPKYGYGKHVNPCIDCRIHRIKKSAELMKKIGADFIATGEVIGQRPMSQRKSIMNTIIAESGLDGLILRPLSARLLPPTLPEQNCWVDREKLLDIEGRSREKQLEYAKKNNLKHGSPGGGCLLTEKEAAIRINDIKKYNPDYCLVDFKLIAYGRHFRINNKAKLVIGRNARENKCLEYLANETMFRFELKDIPGPLGLGIGEFEQKDIELAASFIVRYSKVRDSEYAFVEVKKKNDIDVIKSVPALADLCNKYMVR